MYWSYLFLVPAGVCIIYSFVTLLTKKEATTAHFLFTLSSLVFGFAVISYMIQFRDRQEAAYIYNYFYTCMALLVPPTFYCYICGLTNPRGLTRRNRLTFLPAVLFIIILTFLSFVIGWERYEDYTRIVRYDIGMSVHDENVYYTLFVMLNHYGFLILLILSAISVMIAATLKVHNFHRRFNSFYSQRVEKPELHDTSILVVTYVVIPASAALMLFTSYQEIDKVMWPSILLITIITVSLFMLCRYNHRITYTASDLANEQRRVLLRAQKDEQFKI